MINYYKIIYRKYLNFIIYFFVFSLCFERLTLFGQNLDFFFTKISSSLLIFSSLWDLEFWKNINKLKKYTFWLFLFFSILTLSNYLNLKIKSFEYFDYLFFLNILIFYILGIKFHKNHKLINRALLIFVLGNIFLTLLFFLGIGRTDFTGDLEGRASIFGNNQNYLGLSLTISSLVILYNLFILKPSTFKKIVFIPFLCPLIYFMILTGSRTAFLSFFIGIFLFIVLTNKLNKLEKTFIFSVAFILLIICIYFFQDKIDVIQRLSATFENGDTANRDIIWSGLVYLFSDNILLGVGKTGYSRIIGDLSPHNALLEVFLYTGFIGLFIFLVFLIRLFINSILTYNFSGEFLPIIIFLSVFGILMTGQLFDQKVIWFFMTCLVRDTSIIKNLNEKKS